MKSFKQYLNEEGQHFSVSVTSVGNKPCVEMDNDNYESCVGGKIPFSRWSKYITDEDMRAEVKKMFYKHKELWVKNKQNGSMTKFK